MEQPTCIPWPPTSFPSFKKIRISVSRCGGTVLSVAQVETISTLAHQHLLPIHMDGARIFNAAVALGIPVSVLAQSVDLLMFCFSKGLSVPVGSILVGSKEFIR